MTLTHGSRNPLALHIGLCLTDDDDSAAAYSDDGFVTEVSVNLAGLTVVDLAGYDRDENAAAGDDDDSHGADVLVYDDEDTKGQPHRTWRLMSPAALAAATVGPARHIAAAEAIADALDGYGPDGLDEAIEDMELDDAIEAIGEDAVRALWAA